MIPTSFRTRGVVFAYLLGPPRPLGRQQGMSIHDAVCEALGVDDLTFKFGPPTPTPQSDEAPSGPEPERTRGFAIQMERRIGRGLFKVLLDNQSIQQPVRLLIEYTFAPSPEHIYQDFDVAAAAALGALEGTWQRVLAEVRVRGQVDAQGGDAVAYLAQRILHLDGKKLGMLESAPVFLGLHLETPPGDPTAEDPLHQPKREVKLEVLREDGRCLYLEVMSQWPQLAIAAVPGQSTTISIDAQRLRKFDSPPSAYLGNVMDFINDRVMHLFTLTQD